MFCIFQSLPPHLQRLLPRQRRQLLQQLPSPLSVPVLDLSSTQITVMIIIIAEQSLVTQPGLMCVVPRQLFTPVPMAILITRQQPRYIMASQPLDNMRAC